VVVPKPRKLKSGEYVIRIRMNGETRVVRSSSLRKCQQEAALVKAQMLNEQWRPSETLTALIDDYIAKRSFLSPATIRGYRTIQHNRFTTTLSRPLSGVFDWQGIINAEAKTCSPRTLKNAWGLVSSVLAEQGIRPKVRLPSVPRNERPFLQPEEIPVFLRAIEGDPCELDALLALHGLRRSEILALRPEDIRDGFIHVHAAVVPDEKNIMTRKTTTKTAASTRMVPVLIPRLSCAPFQHLHPDTGRVHINRACAKAGLPEVGFHGLRHTFASLCYSLKLSELETQRLGGWSDPGTMRRIYTHLAEADRSAGVQKLEAFFSGI
jgi:integrase